jgi:predicted NACHT family NTPase
MQKADYLLRLMKQRTDALVVTDEKLQQFLMWISAKSLSVKVPSKPAAVRAFYFALVATLDLGIDSTLVNAFDLALDSALVATLNLGLDRVLNRVLNPALVHTLNLALNPELRRAVQDLKAQLPDPDSDEERFKQWWQVHGQTWTNQLRAVMIRYRNIGHNWQFSKQQQELLQQYYDANTLLVDCLNRSCNVTPAVRSNIEETLLLPIALIEQRGSC